MSIKIMSWVWENSPASGSELLLLLAIADFADDDGIAFPGTKTLAKKTRMSLSSVFRATARLVDRKQLEITERGIGRSTSTYRVIMDGAACGVRLTPQEPEDDTGSGVNLTGQSSQSDHSDRSDRPVRPVTYDRSDRSRVTDRTVKEPTTKVKSPTPRKRAVRAKQEPPPADPETAARAALAKEIVAWWWERLEIKPAGKGAYHSSLRVVGNLLAVGHEAKSIATAAREIGAPLTNARMEIQLGRNRTAAQPAAAQAPRQSTADLRVAQARTVAAELQAELAAQGIHT